MKKVDEGYFVKLEAREKEEAFRRSREEKRLKNNELLRSRLEEIKAESEQLKVKHAGNEEALK